MSAKLITRFRDVAEDGSGIELVVWQVPAPIPPSEHHYKYRLVYLERGRRVAGFDNERVKGDHQHIGKTQHPYSFMGMDQLLEDFIREVEAWRAEH
jgi:hypothetical protein